MLAVASKPLPILFLPMTLFFVYRSSISRKKKLLITISYVVILVVGVAILSFYDLISFGTITFDNHEFWSGFTTISSQFRFDGIILIFLLPLVVGLLMLSRKGIKDADSVMVLILGILLLVDLVTEEYWYWLILNHTILDSLVTWSSTTFQMTYLSIST